LYSYRDFTYDTNRFSDLPQFVKDLHTKNQHWVPIIDAGVAARSWGNYTQYE